MRSLLHGERPQLTATALTLLAPRRLPRARRSTALAGPATAGTSRMSCPMARSSPTIFAPSDGFLRLDMHPRRAHGRQARTVQVDKTPAKLGDDVDDPAAAPVAARHITVRQTQYGGAHVVQGTLARPHRIGTARTWIEAAHTMTQRDAGLRDRQQGAQPGSMRESHGHQVAIGVRSRETRRTGARSGRLDRVPIHA